METRLKTMNPAQYMSLDTHNESSFTIIFDVIEVSNIVIIARSVAKVEAQLILTDDEGGLIAKKDLLTNSGAKVGHNSGFEKYNLRNSEPRKEIFNSCIIKLTTEQQHQNG